jgi:hypothetical protein
VLWYVDTSLHSPAHASTARIQRETVLALSASSRPLLMTYYVYRAFAYIYITDIHNKLAPSIAPYHESILHAFHDVHEVAHNLGDIHPGRCCRSVVDQSTFHSEINLVMLRYVTCIQCWWLVSPFKTNFCTIIAGIEIYWVNHLICKEVIRT